MRRVTAYHNLQTHLQTIIISQAYRHIRVFGARVSLNIMLMISLGNASIVCVYIL